MTREERDDAIDIIKSILDKYEEDECLVTDIGIGYENIKAFKMAIDIIYKYQKIEQIVSDFRGYQKGISCGFGGATYMQMVREVVDNEHGID